MNHRFSQLFCTYCFLLPPNCYRVGHPVILDYERMIHGNIGDALFEITDWIAAAVHYPLNKTVCGVYCFGRFINEVSLFLLPLSSEVIPLLST
jgi:hypothetical protein